MYSLYTLICVPHNRQSTEERRVEREMTVNMIAGNREGFDWIFNRYREPLYRFAFRLLREEESALDTVQEAFIRLLRYTEKLDAEKGVKTLLFTITNNLCLDRLRKSGRRKEGSLEQESEEYFFQPEDSRHTPEKEVFHGELTEALDTAIASLPEKQQQAVLLRQSGELTFAELGEAMGISDRYAKKLIRQALDTLAVKLKKMGFHEGGDQQ